MKLDGMELVLSFSRNEVTCSETMELVLSKVWFSCSEVQTKSDISFLFLNKEGDIKPCLSLSLAETGGPSPLGPAKKKKNLTRLFKPKPKLAFPIFSFSFFKEKNCPSPKKNYMEFLCPNPSYPPKLPKKKQNLHGDSVQKKYIEKASHNIIF
jgi:hypothetical protein